MDEFRKEFYLRYVSAFKTAEAALDERTVRSYWTWCRHKFLPLLDGVDRAAPVLELGSGPGYLLGFLKEAGFSAALGIDVSPEQAAVAATKGLNARAAEVFEFLQNHEGSFAAILAVDFVEHFTRPELMKLFPLIHRALRPGGVVLLQTPNGEGLFPNQVVYGDLTHLTIFTPGSLAQLLRLSDFADLQFRETGPVPKSPLNRLRMLAWVGIKLAANAVRKIETGKTQEIWTENMICLARRAG